MILYDDDDDDDIISDLFLGAQCEAIASEKSIKTGAKCCKPQTTLQTCFFFIQPISQLLIQPINDSQC